MKLSQNGMVSFSIRLAVFQASGGPRMKTHTSDGVRIRVTIDDYNFEP
jgi:hypothetical protein